MSSSREIHKRVKDAVRELSKDNKYVCINIESISEKAKIDARTARLHLELLEEDGFGKFCDPKRKTFSNINENSKGE